MGYTEIYLSSVDNNFPYRRTRDGKVTVNDLSLASHFYDAAKNNVGISTYKHRSNNYEFVTNSYQSAEDYSIKKGNFRIYKATRGGILDVFERVDLDKIVSR